jgi:DNA-binding beta-propeller fold protein YncE
MRPSATALAVIVLLFAAAGCGDGPLVLPADGTELESPRAVGAGDGRLYTLDGTGSLLIFDYDGELITRRQITQTIRGFPTGVTVAPDGQVFVADAHESRVLRVTPDGDTLETYGRGYGSEPGQFVYPQRIAFAGDEFFVTEYGFGANNRVQVFGRKDGRFRRTFGGFGLEGARFSRPEGIAISPDGRVFIVDASHRIIVVTPEGEHLADISEEGGEPGRLKYPFGLAADANYLYVAEYGNHRVSRFGFDGRFAGTTGGLGDGPENFRGPRDIALADGYLFIADTGNDRIVRLQLSDIDWQGAP